VDKRLTVSEPAVRHGAAEAALRAVVSISDDAIFTCDRGSQVTTWGSTAVRLFGRTPDDVVGRPLADLFPPERCAEIDVVAARAAAGARVQHYETEVARSDGLPMPVSLSIAPVADTDGRIRQLAVIARDITEQHVTQATLAEMEARLQEGEALAHLGSWLWDLRTATVQWSLEYHRIHGIDPLDFEGTLESHLTVIVPEDRDRVRAGMQGSVESGDTFEAEYAIVRPDRTVRRLHARAHPTAGSNGRPVGLRGIGQDVTDRPT
jgi:PAS domain S-box-containing protein